MSKAQTHLQKTEAAAKLTAKSAPKLTAKSAPKLTAKSAPKLTAKSAPKVTTKSAPKLTAKSAPKLTAKSASKVTGHGMMVESKPKKGNSEAHPGSGRSISAQERQMLIERAAYLRAEKRGFAAGGELEDWVEAEKEVLQLTGGA